MTAAWPYRWLETGDEFYRTLLADLAAAQSSIRLETYIYAAGAPGDAVRAALVAAARRGVRVQVLLDGFGSLELPGDYWAELAAAGGVCRYFNPRGLTRLVFRDHRKLLVCDARVALVGGFNISGAELGDGVARGWRDLGLRLEGAAAGELAAAFDAMLAWAAAGLRRRRHRRRRPAAAPPDNWPPVALLASEPGRRSALRRALLADFRQAREVRAISAYFLPGRPLRRAWRRIARRGGDVQLITAGTTDVRLARFAGRSLYARLLRRRIRIFEYQPQVLHTKLVVADDVVYVGSANLDNRSLHINYELVLRLADPRLAAEARRLFEGHRLHCRPIERRTWARSRPFWERLAERLAYVLLAHLDTYFARRGLARWR